MIKTKYSLFRDDAYKITTDPYIVYRSKHIRDTLKELWGVGPANKKTMRGANAEQNAVKTANDLFFTLRRSGSNKDMTSFQNYRYDKIHDKYHCHLSSGKNTLVILWEEDPTLKIINIIDINNHENFDYVRSGHDKKSAMEKILELEKSSNKLAI